tara:strand:+ start:157 stop:456 length:300 start_codon:yes stop_codon:yes gene_type:complete
MIPASFAPMILKIILPQIREILAPLFKYKDEPNELDIQMEDVEKKCSDISIKLEAMESVLKDLDDDSHPIQPFDERITKLEEFAKQVRRKKAFKRKDGE